MRLATRAFSVTIGAIMHNVGLPLTAWGLANVPDS